MPRGSKPGERRGGRKPGTPNRRTVARKQLADLVLKDGVTPLEMMLSTARELYAQGTMQAKLSACELAKDAAPYVHPRLSPVQDVVVLPPLDGSLADQGRSVLTSAAAGQITLDQAGAFVQALAAQARIMEVTELEQRIGKLEERANRGRK
jgi:hypothetical protein